MPLILGINRPARRARTYMDKKKCQDESDSDDRSNIDEEENYFQLHNNYTSDEEDDNEEYGVFENWEW